MRATILLHPRMRWLSLAMAVLCVWAVGHFVDLTPQVSGDFFFSTDDPRFQTDRKIGQIFPSRSQVIVSARAPDIRSTEYAARIDRLSGALRALDGVLDVRDIGHGPKNLRDALASPLWRRLLIAEDESATNLFVTLRGTGEGAATIRAIEKTARSFDRSDFDVALSGVPYVVDRIRDQLQRDLETFGVASLIVFGLVTGVTYRSLHIFWGAVTSCVMAASLTLLVRPLLRMESGILTPNITTIVVVLTLSHVVYLTGNWQQAQKVNAGGASLAQAIRWTGPPCFWSMATTLLGFLSLLLGSAKPLREFGLSCAAGSLLALLATYTVYPAYLARAALPRRKLTAALDRRVETLLGDRPRKWPLVVMTGLVLAALPGLARIDTDPTLLSYFAPQGEIRRGLERIDRSGGSSPLELVVRDAQSRPLNDKRSFRALWKLQESLERDPDVGVVISLPVLMAEARRPFFSFLFSWERLLRRLEKPDVDRIARSFVTRDRKYAYLLLRMKESQRERPREEVVERIHAVVRGHGFEPVLTGGLYALQGQLAALVHASAVSGLAGLVVIFGAICVRVARSWRLGLLMIATFALVPLTILGAIGHLGMPLDIISAPGVNIALGVGIDDLVHLVFAYRRLGGPAQPGWRGWQRALPVIWRPILASSIILCLGFAILTLSVFPPTQRLGFSMIAGSLLSDFVALLVFPAAATIGRRTRLGAAELDSAPRRPAPGPAKDAAARSIGRTRGSGSGPVGPRPVPRRRPA